MAERLRKLLLYFRPLNSYWTATDGNEPLATSAGPTGRYPLNFIPRLEQGHYDRFDEDGVPVRLSRKRSGNYNFTTVCSYSLANWQKYLRTGDSEYADVVVKMVRFLLGKCQRSGDGSVLLRETRQGPLSAMNQGEGMSILVRAGHYTGEACFLDAARGCVLPFTRGLDDNGVVDAISANGATWYEEYGTRPVRHVLNGMIYALWGLRDVALASGDSLAEDLFDKGVQSVKRSLGLFDTGYWSRYCISEAKPDYIASIMYHNLHVVQLNALAQQTGEQVFQESADRFQAYGRRITNRSLAGLALARDKVLQRFADNRQEPPLRKPADEPKAM